MDRIEVKFSEWISDGFQLFKNNMGFLVLVGLVAVVLSTVTIGILAGPMWAGMYMIVLRLHRDSGPVGPTVGDIFKGFSYFLPSLLFFLVWGVLVLVLSIILQFIPILGQALSSLIGFVFSAALMFGMLLIVDEDKDFWAASMGSIEVVKSNPMPFLGFGVVTAIIGGVGAVLCGIGVIITIPIQVCIIVVAYEDIFNSSPAAPTARPAAPTSPPPPPPGI